MKISENGKFMKVEFAKSWKYNLAKYNCDNTLNAQLYH
jgi:hypothetical protein